MPGFLLGTRRLVLFVTLAAAAGLPLAAGAQDDDVHAATDRQDVVHFASRVVIGPGQEARDVVCILCSVEVDGTVDRDIVAILGSVQVRGTAAHDVVAIAGNVSVAENASIGHDLVVIGGSRRLASTAVIGHESVIIMPIVILLPFLVVALIIWMIVRFFRWLFYRNRPMYGLPYR